MKHKNQVMAIRVTLKESRVFSTKCPMDPISSEDLGLKPAIATNLTLCGICKELPQQPSFLNSDTR
jgi:hypothetical protein